MVLLYVLMSCGWWMIFCYLLFLYKFLDSFFMDWCGVDRKIYWWYISKVIGIEDFSLFFCGNNYLCLGVEENIVCFVVEVLFCWVFSYVVYMEDGYFFVCFFRWCKNLDRVFSFRKRYCFVFVCFDNIGFWVVWWDGEFFDGYDCWVWVIGWKVINNRVNVGICVGSFILFCWMKRCCEFFSNLGIMFIIIRVNGIYLVSFLFWFVWILIR